MSRNHIAICILLSLFSVSGVEEKFFVVCPIRKRRGLISSKNRRKKKEKKSK